MIGGCRRTGKTSQVHLAVLMALFSPDQSLVTNHFCSPRARNRKLPAKKTAIEGGNPASSIRVASMAPLY